MKKSTCIAIAAVIGVALALPASAGASIYQGKTGQITIDEGNGITYVREGRFLNRLPLEGVSSGSVGAATPTWQDMARHRGILIDDSPTALFVRDANTVNRVVLDVHRGESGAAYKLSRAHVEHEYVAPEKAPLDYK
jgi:hypothetical protein